MKSKDKNLPKLLMWKHYLKWQKKKKKKKTEKATTKKGRFLTCLQ